MTAKQQLKERHEEAIEKLKSVALPKIEMLGLKKACELVAPNVGVSRQTVGNYVYGMAKDGFLTETLIREFKSLKA